MTCTDSSSNCSECTHVMGDGCAVAETCYGRSHIRHVHDPKDSGLEIEFRERDAKFTSPLKFIRFIRIFTDVLVVAIVILHDAAIWTDEYN